MARGSLQILSLATIWLCCSVEAQAAPILWTLSDVSLGDGSSITGFFILDADLPVPQTGLTQYRITVSGGSVLPDFVYTPSDPFSQLLLYTYRNSTGQQVERLNAFRRNPLAFELLYLDLVTFLSDAGGIVPLDLQTSTGQLSNGEVSYATVPVVSGSIIGTPVTIREPGSFVLLMCGIPVLAGLRRLQKRALRSPDV
jgi:hypothetical protein